MLVLDGHAAGVGDQARTSADGVSERQSGKVGGKHGPRKRLSATRGPISRTAGHRRQCTTPRTRLMGAITAVHGVTWFAFWISGTLDEA